MNLHFVAALDSFKGALSSHEAGEAVRRGILRRLPDAAVTVFSVGDGGEGTADALIRCLGAHRHTITVEDTHGTPVDAEYGLLQREDGTVAFLDMAAAASLRFARSHQFDYPASSTYGVGQMLRHLVSLPCREIVLGLGGSGTGDGGIGALCALGAKFFDEAGNPLPERLTTRDLARVASCDLAPAVACLGNTRLTLLYDVAVPLLGDRGATVLFSPQKGAKPDDVPRLEAAMAQFAAMCDAAVGRSVSELPGAGAAGGLGYGLSLIGGQLRGGADFVLSAIGFHDAARDADMVITGEGKTDRQTAQGKLPHTVARASGKTPVVCLCGAYEPDEVLYRDGIDAIFSITDRPLPLEESMTRTAELLEKTAYNLAGLARKKQCE